MNITTIKDEESSLYINGISLRVKIDEQSEETCDLAVCLNNDNVIMVMSE